MAYPANIPDRLSYWQQIIEHAELHYKPEFDACAVLQQQYNMSAATLRESLMEEYGDDPGMRIKANMVFSWVEQMIANQASQEPEVTATAKNEKGIGSEKSVGPIINYFYRETEQLEQDKRVLLDAYLSLWGVWKLGYAIDKENAIDREVAFRLSSGDLIYDTPEDEFLFLISGGGAPSIVTEDQDHQDYIEHHVSALQDPFFEADDAGVFAVEENIKERRRMLERGDPEGNSSVKWEGPWALRWKPSDFLIDPEAQDALRDAQWIAFRFRRSLDDIQSDPSLNNTEDLEATTRSEKAPDGKGGLADPFAMVEGWEIWARNFPIGRGRRRNLRMIIVPGHDKFLVDEDEWPYEYLEDYPCELFSLTKGVDTWYNKPPLLLSGGDSQQSLVNEILDGILSVVRKQKNIFLYDSDLLDEEEVAELMDMEDMSALPIRGLSRAQGRAMEPLQFGQVQGDKHNLLSTVQSLFDRSAGSPQPLSSINPESATEADIVDRSAASRENERTSNFNRAILRKVRKWWQLIVEFHDEENPRQYPINPSAQEAADRFLTMDKKTAQGEYLFRIDVSSHQENKVSERRQGMDLLNLVAGLVPLIQEIHGQPPNIGVILERIMRRGFEWDDVQAVLPFLGQESAPVSPDLAAQLTGQTGESNPLQEAVNAGAQQGPLQPGAFNAPLPSPANQQAAAQRPTSNQKAA